jgi:predicted metal-dependent phosphoesterase TrpH
MTRVVFKKVDIPSYYNKGYTGYDMHFHTEYSMDGLSRIKDVIKKAYSLGIGVAITDHNQIKGNVKASKNKLGVNIIPGIEVTCVEGVHTLYYFYTQDELQEFYKKEVEPHMTHNPFFAHIKTEELMIKADKYNCIIDSPHPFAPGITGIHKIKITKEMKKRIKIIEGLNGYNLRKLNKKAIFWAAQSRKPMTAGSDGHTTTELAQVLTFAKASDTEEVFKQILKNMNILQGVEEKLLEKAILAFEKEETYLNRAHKRKEEKLLLKSQFGTEYNYLRQSIKKKENDLLAYFKMHHW